MRRPLAQRRDARYKSLIIADKHRGTVSSLWERRVTRNEHSKLLASVGSRAAAISMRSAESLIEKPAAEGLAEFIRLVALNRLRKKALAVS